MDSLSKSQLLSILRSARSVRERDFLVILVGYSHGLRASEVIAIKRRDIRDGFLTVSRLKGSLRTVQPLVTDANPLLDERKALLDFTREMVGNQVVFKMTRRTFARIIERHGKTAHVPRHLCHPHALKHTVAMQTIHSAGIENVRQYLGHKSISSTGAYLKVSDADACAAMGAALRA